MYAKMSDETTENNRFVMSSRHNTKSHVSHEEMFGLKAPIINACVTRLIPEGPWPCLWIDPSRKGVIKKI